MTAVVGLNNNSMPLTRPVQHGRSVKYPEMVGLKLF